MWHPTAKTARLWVLLALVALGPAVAGCTSPSPPTAEAPGAHASVPGIRHFFDVVSAPEIDATTVDGESIQLSDFVGKVVLIEFMGAGCSACLANLPHHKATYAAFQDNPNFALLAFDIWTNEDEDDLRNYRDRHDIPWPMSMAPPGTARAYSASGTPTHFFIDHLGNYHSTGGYLTQDSMTQELEFLLSEIPSGDSPA